MNSDIIWEVKEICHKCDSTHVEVSEDVGETFCECLDCGHYWVTYPEFDPRADLWELADMMHDERMVAYAGSY